MNQGLGTAKRPERMWWPLRRQGCRKEAKASVSPFEVRGLARASGGGFGRGPGMGMGMGSGHAQASLANPPPLVARPHQTCVAAGGWRRSEAGARRVRANWMSLHRAGATASTSRVNRSPIFPLLYAASTAGPLFTSQCHVMPAAADAGSGPVLPTTLAASSAAVPG